MRRVWREIRGGEAFCGVGDCLAWVVGSEMYLSHAVRLKACGCCNKVFCSVWFDDSDEVSKNMCSEGAKCVLGRPLYCVGLDRCRRKLEIRGNHKETWLPWFL